MEATLAQIKTLIVESEERTRKEMQQLEQRTREGMQQLEQRTREEFANFKHDIIRWMVGLFLGSAVLVISSVSLYTGMVSTIAQSLQQVATPTVSASQMPAKVY